MGRSIEYQPGDCNRLARNKETQAIKRQGLNPVVHVANEAEWWFKLREELGIATARIFDSQNLGEMKSAMVDAQELLRVVAQFAGIEPRELESAREDAESLTGSYSKRIILDKIE